MFLRLLLLFCFLSTAVAGDINFPTLQDGLDRIASSFNGRLGACVAKGSQMVCVRGSDRFSMQSVMKLIAGAATLRAVDAGVLSLSENVTLYRKDLSLYVQPIANLVGSTGYSTSIGDLIRRAIIESDSAAVDFLIRKLGGPKAVQGFLQSKSLDGIRLDRDERHLQTAIVGLQWRPEYVNPKLLDAAIAGVPAIARDKAYRTYQRDVRDTSTPEAMTRFLVNLFEGKLLTPNSTSFAIQAMADCVTFPNRLKAGIPPDWKLAHKTGTSGSWRGITAATNDVGVLTLPDGNQVAVSVFAADSSASSEDRAAVIASVSRTIVRNYRHE